MVECYKLLFDLSLYFTVFGYFLSLIAKTTPSSVFFLLQSASVMLDAFLRTRKHDQSRMSVLRYIPLILPILTLIARPSLPQIIHALPVWFFLGFSMYTDRVHTDYSDFRSHFSFGMWLLPLMIFGALAPSRFVQSLVGAIPYLICMLTCGVCLLRMLREERPDGIKQGVIMAIFILLCAVLTIGKAPQLLVKAFGYVYHIVIAPLIFAISILFAVVFYAFYLFMKWFVSHMRGSDEPLEIEIESAAEMLGLDDELQTYTADLRWLKTLLLALAVLLVLLILFLIFKRLLGEKNSEKAANPWSEREEEPGAFTASRRKNGLMRPRDPRLAVRWYYWHFLSECRRRGVNVSSGTTASELSHRCSDAFPEADPDSLTALYLPARYDLHGQISSEDASRAAELWHTIKRSSNPNDLAAKEKKRKTS